MTKQRQYTSSDMARLSSRSCAGCGACCRGMGDTILLDPYDMYMLTSGLGKTFNELLGEGIDLHVERGIILPHLKMDEDRQECHYLGSDGRCTIHASRPGLCRLFPLGRQFNGMDSDAANGNASKYSPDRSKTVPATQGITYFLLEDACTDPHRAKVRIDKWLGIPDLPRYEAFKWKWHRTMRTLAARLAAEDDPVTARNINVFLLQTFYVEPYSTFRPAVQSTQEHSSLSAASSSANDFYTQWEARMEKFWAVL